MFEKDLSANTKMKQKYIYSAIQSKNKRKFCQALDESLDYTHARVTVQLTSN